VFYNLEQIRLHFGLLVGTQFKQSSFFIKSQSFLTVDYLGEIVKLSKFLLFTLP